MKATVTLRGIDDVNDLLTKVAPRQGYNIMRATVHGMAGQIRDEAKKKAPKDEGDLRKGIKAKRERSVRGRLLSTVRAAPFYWRFLEYGQGPDNVEHAFFLRSVEEFRADMHARFLTEFGKKWEAALARAAKRNGR